MKVNVILLILAVSFEYEQLRILHLSHGSLPDWRIEKSAISLLKFGHEVMFGGIKSINYKIKIFSKIYEIDWPQGAKFGLPIYWHSVRKQFERVIRESRPDVVHAHNIFSAKMLSEFEIPFVYDDHEYTSVYVRSLAETVKLKNKNDYNDPSEPIANKIANISNRMVRKIAWKFLRHRAISLWTNWEKELVLSSTPIITTTDSVATELAKRRDNIDRVFVVPNFPMNSEGKDFEKPYFHSRLSSVYAGKEISYASGIYPHRNLDGLTDVFANHEIGELTMIGTGGQSSAKIKYLPFLTRRSMYDEMLKHSIGLLPFKKHWSHQYKSPNKQYEYAHAGLFVMCTSSFKSVIESFKSNCSVFEDYSDMASQLKYFRDNLEDLYSKRLRSFEFARNNLVWEKYDKNILRAYQSC